ncbi:putative carboxylesterase 17 [Apostasia shenzhenica]|uniref:Putative carboxylesterase 17 n=1 Tax=Apostasia shenzhenica TaxID=1088818 RepID=A0A2I0ASR1_9ASPA|nr:putative carboxylesterase 17 [Apostasia shenzhenica]
MVAGAPVSSLQVVDEVSGWLRIFSDGSVDRSWTGPPGALPLMSSVAPHSIPLNGVSLLDLPGEPNLRIYLPAEPAPLLPILLHFHGGGFCISHFSWLMYYHFYARIAGDLPAVVVSVELPLAPERRLPAAIYASYSALLRLRSLAGDGDDLLRSRADFSRVFLIGDSSGGNLVHHLAAMAGEAEEKKPGFWSPLRLAGGIAIHPGFVRSRRSQSEGRLEWETPFLTLDMIDKFLELALPKGFGKDHPYTCPMGEAAPEMEKLRLPPMMVVVAERDLIKDTEMEYCTAMEAANKKVEVFYQREVGHSYYLNKFAVDGDPATARKTTELVVAIKDFVDRH